MKMSQLFTVVALLFLSACTHRSISRPAKFESHNRAISASDTHEEWREESPGLTLPIPELTAGEDHRELVEVEVADDEIQKSTGTAALDEPELADDVELEFLEKRKSKRRDFWITYFSVKDRERFQRFLKNGAPFKQDIQKILRSYGLPEDLYYVGLIESGYNLKARSRASAVGPWQFIKGTGRRYGLRVTSEIDERRDIYKATHAAARYFRDLYNVFNSWELSLAAYNAGEYGIIRRIMRFKTRDYYELSRRKYLPRETINYVPKVLAAIHIAKNSERYGFIEPVKPSALYAGTDLYPVRKNTSLRRIARKLGISYRTLRSLNPELKRSRTPRWLAGAYKIRVPSLLSAKLIPAGPESRKEVMRRTASVKRRTHRVRRGETLIGIARKYRTTAGRLARLNGLKSWRSHLRIGQRLKVSGKARSVASRKSYRPLTYTVRRGDNLNTLSRLFRTSVRSIKRANSLRSGRIFVGQKLVLPNTKRGVYVVKRGDYLGKIASRFNQPMGAILKLNKLKRKVVYPGQRLIVDID